jgi:TonB family protein
MEKTMFRMFNRLCLVTLCSIGLSAAASAQSNLTAKAGSAPATAPVVETDRSRDGLIGPVRRVRTEIAKLLSADGGKQEGKHQVVEVTAYDLKGNKIENQYFPIAGATLTGKEVYKYDEKGNISEMTLLNPDGTLLSKETYKYEFDFLGNWSKMTTSVAMVDSRGITFEPTEVTYRSIMYYLDENMVKMVTPPANGSGPTTNAVTNPQPAAPITAAPAPAKPESKPAGNNKNTKKAAPAPELPLASSAATKLASGPVDLKVQNVSTNQPLPVVMIDEPPPSPGPKPILKPVSGGVLNGTAVALPAPLYPDAAKRMRTQGVVTVDVVLDETGKVVSANASSGPQILRDAAVQAALKARFSPTKLSGQPVKVSGVINYKFALIP